MNKFKDIQIGDKVYFQHSVRTGWHSSRRFWLPVEVTKTTPTQITLANGKRVRKQDGKIIGGSYGDYVKALGDTHYHGELIEDQTEQKKAFEEKLELEKQFNFTLKSIGEIKPDSHFTTEELQQLLSKANQLHELFIAKTVREI